MSKRILTVIAIVLAVSGLTFANIVNITQIGSVNNATALQTYAGNTLNATQNATTNNDLNTAQHGNNGFTLEQIAGSGYNDFDLYQNGSSFGALRQIAPSSSNNANIHSSNGDLVGSTSGAVLNPGGPARQRSLDSDNTLILQQNGWDGSGNVLGLTQDGDGYNYAEVRQVAPHEAPVNSAVAWQYNVGGTNWLRILQDTGDSARVSQSTGSGWNWADINQTVSLSPATANVQQSTIVGNNFASITQ